MSENDKQQRHSSNPLTFIRRSFSKRKNSSTRDNPVEEFTFVRNNIPTNQEQTERCIYLHIPGQDKFLVELKPDQTLREVLRPILNNLNLLPELYEYRQADNLNIVQLDKNSLLFSGKNILLQQHTESFILTMQLSSQPIQEYILRTSNSKTILDIIQPILSLKGISKDSVSLHLADCNVPIQLDVQSTVLNKQRVEMIGQDSFGTLKVKTGGYTSPESSPTRDSKQELFKTQYPKRKVNKIRTSLRGKKEKSANTKEMFSLIESAQGNRLNDQRSERQDNFNKTFLPDKPPKIPANSNTNRSNNADICPHTGEVLFQNDVYQPKHNNVENRPIVPPIDRLNTDPPKYTPHKPTTRVPLNLAEAKFQQNQVTSFAQNLKLNNNAIKYHIAPNVQANSYNYTQNYNPYQTGIQPHSTLPVAPVYSMQRSQQSLFYKGTQHVASTKITTHYNSGYIDKTNEMYKETPVINSTRAILAVPSPFDDCNLPSRMNFSQNLSPNLNVHNNLASPVILGYRQVPVNTESKLTNSYQKTVHPPSYL
ncbi:hypothetical protein LOD99_704 [Oopsacas minuta]|uniref:RBD domain-containing protein n=1 Tax=Oopsacas minuta TaxID=111878 RepID=A0AAV7JZG2_9METZ|nr:hypothetical protein LOD99_704 [Oopsacas minuta]